MKSRRKPSRKAKAEPKVYRNLLEIPESVRRKLRKREPTPEEQAEAAETWRRIFTPGPAWGDDDESERDRIAGVVRLMRPRESENMRLLRMLIKQQKAQAAQPVRPKKPKGGRKFNLVLEILADIKPASGLEPAEIEKKVLPKFRVRWATLKPDDKTDPPVSRKVINGAYQIFVGARSSK